MAYIYRRRLWLWLFGLVDRLGYSLSEPRRETPDLSTARSILVMKLDQIGDLILSFPLIEALQRVAPRARLEMAVAEGRSHVVEGMQGIAAVHELPVRMRAGEGRNDIRYPMLWKAMCRLRHRRFEVVVVGKEDPVTVLLSFLLRAPVRVGFVEGGLGFLLTHYVPIPVRGKHQWEILVSLSGLDPGEVGPPRFPIGDEATAEAQRVESELGGDSSMPLIVVHPGAGVRERRWSAEYFVRVVSELSRNHALRFVITKGPDDRDEVPTPRVGPPSRLAVLDRPLPLPVFAALLSRADLFLGNESAPAHVAASVGTPAVVPFLYGTDPDRWGPHGERNRVVTGPVGKGPEPDRVVWAAAEVLALCD